MSTPLRLTALAVVFTCAFPFPAAAGGRSPAKTNCPWWRPCGPGETYGGNRLIPQGALGVDARPACERHDECYRNATGSRKDCDKAFLNDLRCACENSRRPKACNRRATMAYVAVRLLAGSAYGTP